MASFMLFHAETRDYHSRRGMGARTIAWDRCTPLTIVDQFGIKLAASHLPARPFTEEEKSRMSDFSCERRRCVWTHRLFLWLEKGP